MNDTIRELVKEALADNYILEKLGISDERVGEIFAQVEKERIGFVYPLSLKNEFCTDWVPMTIKGTDVSQKRMSELWEEFLCDVVLSRDEDIDMCKFGDFLEKDYGYEVFYFASPVFVG